MPTSIPLNLYDHPFSANTVPELWWICIDPKQSSAFAVIVSSKSKLQETQETT